MILSLDTETTGLDANHGAKPFFVTICDEEGVNTYWEWDVNPETRQPLVPKEDLFDIQEMLNEADEIVLQNPKFDVRMLRTLFDGKAGRPRLRWDWSKVRDTLLAGHLLASNQPHDLTTMALVYLGINIKPLEDAIDEAAKEAQKIARRKANSDKYGTWRIAKRGLPEMPSAKEKTFKFDMWLPRAIAIAEGYPKDHEWFSVLSDYGNGDSSVTLPLYLRQKEILEERGLWRIYQERLKLLPVLDSMESRGVSMSKTRKDELYQRLSDEAEKCRRVCINVSGGAIEKLPVNGVSNALKEVVFGKFGLVSPKKTDTGQPSMDKFVLDHWLATLPERSKPYLFIKNLRDYRKRKTALGYMDSYEKFWLPSDDGSYVVYPSLNPTGTDTLRFSSSNPNEQQISKQEDVNLRYCFGPAPGREWWSMDANNIELRLPAYEAGEEVQIRLFEHPDEPPYYGSNHLLVFDILHHDKFIEPVCPRCLGQGCTNDTGKRIPCLPAVPLCEIKGGVKHLYASTWYQWTKNGNFAIQYGAVEQSGTADRAYHVPGAQHRIQSRFTKVKELNDRMIEFARKHGYVETMPDKTVDPKRGYPLLCTRTRWGDILPTVPLNYHIQGTAMWWMSKAMVRCQAKLDEWRAKTGFDAYIIMQVHDELVFDFPKSRVHPKDDTGKSRRSNLWRIRILQKLMEKGGDDLGIPTPVSCEYHENNWSEGIAV